MSKTLILSDIHNNYNLAETIISKVKPDLTIQLGDAFDDFDDTYEMIAETAEWFHYSINQKNRIHIAGNHDVHYWFKDNPNVRCSGYEQAKSIVINNRIKPEDWNKLKFFYVLDDWILSHAGVHPYWIDPVKERNGEDIIITKDTLVKKLERDAPECVKQLKNKRSHWFEICGHARSHASPFVGGIIWLDFNYEFTPIRGIHQIVGHTPSDKIRWRIMKENDNAVYAPEGAEPELNEKTSFNVCFDSSPTLKWCAIYEDKSLKIIETKNL